MSQADIVLSIPELFEAILLHVDSHTLLTSAQRVCRRWHNIISTTPSIQKTLYFRPEMASPSREKRINPLLQAHFLPWFGSSDHVCDRDLFMSLPLYLAGSNTGDNPFLRPKASWRRMLISQPPVQTFGIYTEIESFPLPSSHSEVGTYIHSNEEESANGVGLCMGKYYDIVKAHFASHESPKFSVIWNTDKMSREIFLELVDPSVYPDNWQENLDIIFNCAAEVTIQLYCHDCLD